MHLSGGSFSRACFFFHADFDSKVHSHGGLHVCAMMGTETDVKIAEYAGKSLSDAYWIFCYALYPGGGEYTQTN